MEIKAPAKMLDIDAINFLHKIDHYRNEMNLTINHEALQFVCPFATLVAAIGVRDLVRYRRDRGLKTRSIGHKNNTGALDYLKHVGFFRFIGLNVGKGLGEAPGGQKYIPITELNETSFHVGAGKIQDSIENEAGRLSQLLYSSKKDECSALMLSYCFREIIRNVFEHAETTRCFAFAQKWETGYAEIAIADEGIGLMSSLNRVHHVPSPEEAIVTALMPGISSDISLPNDDKWQNSGFGLYIISELGVLLGEFSIASGNAILLRNRKGDVWHSVPIRGTIVKVKINTKESEYFPNMLEQIVAKGEETAKAIPRAKKHASKTSRIPYFY